MFLVCVISFMAAALGSVFGLFLLKSNGLWLGNFFGLYFPNDNNSAYMSRMWVENGEALTALRDQLSAYLGITALCMIVTITAFVFLCIAVGDRDNEGNVALKAVDRLYTEIQLFMIAALLIFGGGLFVRLSTMALKNTPAANGTALGKAFINLYEPSAIAVIIACTVGTVAAYISLWMFMSCVRKIKARCFLKQSLIGQVFLSLYKALYAGGSLMRKVMFTALLGCVLSATILLAPVMLILIVIFIPKFVKEFEEIKHGVDEVKNGNLEYRIPKVKSNEFNMLGIGINEISQSSNITVQNEMKNQRMKAELISNVSHDLKTPLTSMVTYIDLLKAEGLASENAPGYIDILDQKTGRLKQLTEDLFEAAKASSGTIPVKKEKVDMLSLINQGLGEMDQRIKESGLVMIVKAEKERYWVWADGQLLWRVFENLLGNVLKYAQENTRVYIDISEQESEGSTLAVLEIKNISKQPLNIAADELLERFKRGDESRTTEGSGLGLAIANDLVKLQDGRLDIKIDGDLFKATVLLEKADDY